MNDEQMQSLLCVWYREREVAPRSVRDGVASVMANVPRTRRQGRWWPLPTLDRPVSPFPGRELAPAPIPATDGPTPTRGFTMFSAVKFIVAGFIVALFGGFLLTGILTTQQGDEADPAAVTESPGRMTTDELLLGVELDYEEVEPGVFRVVNDGVRDITPPFTWDIVAGHDGGTWLLREDNFLRLGSGVVHQWPNVVREDAYAPGGGHGLEVAPDGTMWVIPCGSRPFHTQCGDARRSTDGEEWTVEPCPEGSTDCQGFMVAPDGTVWASWKEGSQWRVGHLGPSGWQPLDGLARDGGSPFRGYQRLFVTDAGDIFGMDRMDIWRYIFRSEDGGWESFFDLFTYNPWRTLVDVGPDGTVWLGLQEDKALTRWVHGEWERWVSEEFLPDTRYTLGLVHEFKVAPDGSLWFDLWQQATGTDDGFASTGNGDLMGAVGAGRVACDGLARFDGHGDPIDRFLPGQCISMDIAADGSVWVLAASDLPYVFDDELGDWVFADDHPWALYVITPEAVAAAG